MMDKPPATRTLQEVIIAAHFGAPLPLTLMDVADWVRHFDEFSIVQQLPPLPAAQLPVPGGPTATFQLVAVDHATLPRMLLRSPDGRYFVQLQADRFAFGWSRIEPPGALVGYPGFENFSEKWNDVLGQFNHWTELRFQHQPIHRLIELSYSNAAVLDRDGKRRRLSEIFKFVQPGVRRVNMFNVNWMERLYPEETTLGFTGAVTSSVGMGETPQGAPALIFNFFGLAAVAPEVESKHILNDLHAKIREIYEGSIVADA